MIPVPQSSARPSTADINNLSYFKNLYSQNYIKTDYLSGEQYRRQQGNVRRAIAEKAMLFTEAYKLSVQGQNEINKLPPQKRSERIEFVFQKYCAFYAYSNQSRKYRRGLHDIMNECKDFYRTYTSEESRALARKIKIRTLANGIDHGSENRYGFTPLYQPQRNTL